MDKIEILLRRKNKLVITRGSNKLPTNYVASLNKNIESLGYIFAPEVIKVLATLDLDKLVKIYNKVITVLKVAKGVRDFKPMYPNFPKQVMDMSEYELYSNAFLHYFSSWIVDFTGNSDFIWVPTYDKVTREPLIEKVKLTVIKLGTENEVEEIFQNLMSSNTSISQTDKDDLKLYLSESTVKLPQNIPHKEVLAYVGSLLINKVDMTKYFKTSTDVLRLAVGLSGGDVSLATPCKFRNFKRSERRYLLNLLENTTNMTEDMLLWKGRWIRLGERLHPGEYQQFAKANVSFDILRNNKPFATFNSKVESGIIHSQIKQTVALLKSKPGQFARRLDKLLRTTNRHNSILSEFESVATQISTPVLLQVLAHFKSRNNEAALRVFFPKGNVGKVQAISNLLPELKQDSCDYVVKICEGALDQHFRTLPKLGNCYIDDNLKECLVPFSQRSASKTLRTLTRGSKLSFPVGDTIRFFIYWHESRNSGRIDIDLSSTAYDKNWHNKGYIAYYNLKNDVGCHSGDKTSAPNGACEFIDLSIDKMLAQGTRYVAMTVNSFTHQKYKDLPECFAGWMIRQKPQSGEVFEPKTVIDRVDLTCEATACVPMLIDLQERKVIWLDMPNKARRYSPNNLHSNYDTVTLVCKAFTELAKPNLYDLFSLHAKARGKIVKNKDKADIVFSMDGTVTPFDIDKIGALYLC